MNDALYVTADIIKDIMNFVGLGRMSRAEAVTFEYLDGFKCNIKIDAVNSEINIKVYK